MTAGVLAPAGIPGLSVMTAAESPTDVIARLAPVFAIDASKSLPGEQMALNLGTGGQLLRARYGSVGAAEVRGGVLYMPTNNPGNAYVSIPLVNAVDVEIVCRLMNTTDSGTNYPFGNLSGNMSFGVYRDSTSLLNLLVKDSGGSNTGVVGVTRSSYPWLTAGAYYWTRIRRNGTTGVWSIEIQPDGPRPTSWGAPSTGTGPTGALTGMSACLLGKGGNPDRGSYSYYEQGTTWGLPSYIADFAQCPDLATSFTGNHGYGVKAGTLVLPIGVGYASAPDANYTGNGDVSIRVQAACDWTTTSFGALIGNTNQVSTGFRFYTGNGTPRLGINWWDSGTGSFRGISANADTPLAANADAEVRVDLDRDNGAGQCAASFYYRLGRSGAWTPIGTTVTLATVANVSATLLGQNLGIGSQKGDVLSNGLRGSYKRAVIYNDLTETTKVFEADFTSVADNAQSFVCSTGQTVTINGCALPTITITNPNAVDTNDPRLATYEGRNYLDMPGTIGNYIVSTGLSALGSLTNIEFVVRARFDAIGGTQYLAGWGSTHAAFALVGSKLVAYVLNTGVAQIGNAQSAIDIPGLTAGVDVWLWGEVNTTTATCTYRYSFDDTDQPGNVSWTLLGAPQVGSNAGTTPVLTQSNLVTAGAHSAGVAGFAGRLLSFRHRTDGVVRMEFRASVQPEANQQYGTLVPDAGPAGIAITRTTSGRKIELVTCAVWLCATDDYLAIADNVLLNFDIGDSYTHLTVVRDFATGTGYAYARGTVAGGAGQQGQIVRKVGTTAYYMVQSDVADRSAPNNTATYGKLQVFGGCYDGPTKTPKAILNTTVTPGPALTGTTTKQSNIAYVGGGALGPYEGAIRAVAVFNRQLTAAEIAQYVAAYLGAAA